MEQAKVAIIYHTSEGHTEQVAERVGGRLREAGLAVEVFSLEDAPPPLAGYHGVVLGGPVHAGKHDRALVAYATSHRDGLAGIPNAFFSVGLMAANPDERHQRMASGFVEEFIDETGWQPDLVALIGGALAYRQYGFIKRQLVKAVVKREGGDTDTSRNYDYTDWEAVDAFADDFAAHLRESRAAGGAP